MGELRIMNRKGDSRIMWDPNNDTEIKAARKQFDELKKSGYLAYRVNPESAGKGDMIREFDPYAGKIILAPPQAGG